MQFKTLGAFALLAASFGASQVQVQAAPAQVRSVTPQSLKAEIARNKGKVVVVNFWATWCAPCVKELPALAQLQAKTAGKGAVLLLVSADDPGIKNKVALVAGSKGHRVTRQISSDIDIFFGGFDPKNKDSIALPRTYIYNRKGVLVKTITQEQTLAGYQSILKPYL
jgi:thiol-disulfide isomerase/thioredoxin